MKGTTFYRSESRIQLAAWTAGIAILCSVLIGHAAATSSEGVPTTAERLVREADQAARSGAVAQRFALLREAVRIDPDYQLARWQLGQVQVGGEWLSIEEAQRRAAADPKQAVYRERRAELGESPAGQLALARWCRKNGLEEESRFHWASLLSTQPRHREALRALRARWIDGQLMTREQLDSAKDEQLETRRASRAWRPRLATWQRSIIRNKNDSREQALGEIRALDDPSMIVPFEAVTLTGDPTDEKDSRWRSELSLAFITALEGMSDHAATVSLARHAVLSPFAAVRHSATDRLRYRPLHDFVPELLDALSMPLESTFRVVTSADGSVHYLHSLYREGSHADWSSQRRRSAVQQAIPQRVVARLADDIELPDLAAEAQLRAGASISAMQASARYAGEAAAVEAEVAQWNQAAAARNELIIAVLANVSGKDLGSRPRDWWDWWTEHNEYDPSYERPVYESNEVSYESLPTPPVAAGGGECFAKGTPVWTKTGQHPVETLELGDMVLAQNVDTGELAYKPVIGRTVRPPSPLLRISVGDEELLATRGHPFWVAGTGWRMAKEVQAGAVLHGITSTPHIESIEPAGEAEAYNLVVADFSTYFVGESGVLVHDNTRRRPTRAIAPGLVSK